MCVSINISGKNILGPPNLTGINNAGQIVGSFQINAVGQPFQSFIDTNGSIKTIVVPGAFSTKANAINNAGEIVGTFIGPSGPTQGFVDKNGVITTFSVPKGFSLFSLTGVNDAGVIVGAYFVPGSGGLEGFVDDNGAFTTIAFPGSQFGEVDGINDAGQIV